MTEFHTPPELSKLFEKKRGKQYGAGSLRNPPIETLGEKYAKVVDCKAFYNSNKDSHHLVTTYEILGKEEGFDDDLDEGKEMKSWDNINLSDPEKDPEKQMERLVDRAEKLGGVTGELNFEDLPSIAEGIKEASPLVSLDITPGKKFPGVPSDYWINVIGKLE